MSTATIATAPPSLDRFFETTHAFHRTAALKAAVDVDVFTAIDEGAADAAAIAARCGASERGIRILCDYLTVAGWLSKHDGRYALAPDAAFFLSRRSHAYVGGSLEFLLSSSQVRAFDDLAGAVRRGGTMLDAGGVVAADHPGWVTFARGMAGIMRLPAQLLADLLGTTAAAPRVLDIAAGHGLYGIAVAAKHPSAEVTAVDWPSVLTLAQANAAEAGLTGRYHTVAGDALSVEWGGGYDIALLTNILHHFDLPAIERLLTRVSAALRPGGRAAILEFIPDEDRVQPAIAAQFGLMMLATTPGGDAYTYAQYDAVLRRAGFSRSELHALPPTYFRAVIASK